MKEKTIPVWFKRGSIYQVNLRNFCDKGTIESLTTELPFLKELGFTTIYLCPIFEEDDCPDPKYISPRQAASKTGNPKNPYRMNDYFEIDEEYGSLSDLKTLVREAHRLDLKVMLDLVYLHIGPHARVIEEFPNFAKRDENGNIVLTPWNFPTLNFDDEGLCEYLWCNMAYYIGHINADGFRLDTGDRVPLFFWSEGRRRIKAIKPDCVLLNEGSNPEYLKKAFDAEYGFKWHEALFNVATGVESVSRLENCHKECRESFGEEAILVRDIENHDIVTDWSPRVEIAAGHSGMEAILALNYIIDGIPMLFCGNELADSAHLSMFANRFYMGEFEVTNRDIKNEPFSLRRQEIIKRLNALKKESDILEKGKTVWLKNSKPQNIISFERVLGDEKIVFIANLSKEDTTCEIENFSLFEGINILVQSTSPIKSEQTSLHLPSYSYLVAQINK